MWGINQATRIFGREKRAELGTSRERCVKIRRWKRWGDGQMPKMHFSSGPKVTAKGALCPVGRVGAATLRPTPHPSERGVEIRTGPAATPTPQPPLDSGGNWGSGRGRDLPKSHSCLGAELDSNIVSCLPNVAQSHVFNSSNRTVTLQKATSCSPPGPFPKSLQERSCLRALPSPFPRCPAPSTGPGTEQLLCRPCTSTTLGCRDFKSSGSQACCAWHLPGSFAEIQIPGFHPRERFWLWYERRGREARNLCLYRAPWGLGYTARLRTNDALLAALVWPAL